MGDCNPGLQHTTSMHVDEDQLADAVGSDEVPVLGTPALLGLAEEACMAAIAGDLPDEQTSVGSWAEVEQVRPSPAGADLRACATLRGHHGRRLEFVVVIRDGDEIVARVRHRRELVDREHYMAKLHDIAAAHAPA